MKTRSVLLIVAFLVCNSIRLLADNIIQLSSVEGAYGIDVNVDISLTNTSSVSTLQVSIPLGESLAFVEGSGLLNSRCDSHSLSMGVKDGILNVVIYSVSMAPISGNSGEVVTFKLRLIGQPADISLVPSKTSLIDDNGNAVVHSVQNGSVRIVGAKAQFGSKEINFGKIAVHSSSIRPIRISNAGNADLIISGVGFSDVNTFSTTTTFPLTLKPNKSSYIYVEYLPTEIGDIERSMTLYCNSFSTQNTIKLKAQPYTVNELKVQSASGNAGDEVTVSLTMNNMDAVSGFQMEFNMPNTLEFVDGSFTLSSRKQDHVVIASLVDGTLRALAYSSSDTPFSGNSGEIASFRVKLTGSSNVNLNFSKAVLSATINNNTSNVISGYSGATIVIYSPILNAAKNLDMGTVLITEACEKTFRIYNKGSAPLSISNITFDDENLTVKETLPLTIPANQNGTITVAHNGKTDATITSTMRIFSNAPEQQLFEVQVTGSRISPNYFEVEIPTTNTIRNLNVDVSVNCYDAITGLQFDLVYPGDYYEPFVENGYTLETRAQGMTVISRQIDKNTLRYFCYFLNGGGIAAGNGKVMTLKLKNKIGEVPVGEYVVETKNIKLGTAEMANKYAGTDTETPFEVEQGGIRGDANGDGYVSVTDIAVVVNDILSIPNGDNFSAEGADANGDGKITVTDIGVIVDIILGTNGANARKKESMEPQ